MTLTKNMGDTDRLVRAVLGAALVLLALTGQIGAWGWLGVLLIATAAMGSCPAYLPFGVSTRPRSS